MDSDRLVDAVEKIPDDVSMVHIAWTRVNEEGFVIVESNTLVFEEPVPDEQQIRMASHLACMAGNLGTMLRGAANDGEIETSIDCKPSP